MKVAKKILLDELKEQSHPERVGDVIFWALEHYANSEPKGTLGRAIAYSIKERILEAEKNDSTKIINFPCLDYLKGDERCAVQCENCK